MMIEFWLLWSSRRNQKKNSGIKIVKESDRYIKIVEWSDTDECFIGPFGKRTFNSA